MREGERERERVRERERERGRTVGGASMGGPPEMISAFFLPKATAWNHTHTLLSQKCQTVVDVQRHVGVFQLREGVRREGMMAC